MSVQLIRSLVRSVGIALKRRVPPDSGLRGALSAAGRFLPDAWRVDLRDDEVAAALHRFARRRDHVFFVQIGAGDGTLGDPLRLYIERDGWSGLLVEPVPWIYERLRRSYEGRDDLVFENVVVGASDGWQEFHYLPHRGPELPAWAHLIGSLDRDVVLRHAGLVPRLEERLVSRRLPCLRLETLLRRHGIRRIDLLHVDAEGSDARILAQLDLDRLRPEIILYEDKHLSAAERRRCAAHLRHHGYALCHASGNTLARRPSRARPAPAADDGWRTGAGPDVGFAR